MKKIILHSIYFFVFIVLASEIYAQDRLTTPPDSMEVQMHTVSVTAEKREQKMLSVPIAISALNYRTLEMKGVENLRDLTLRVPNLFMPDYGMKLSAPVFIRGIGSKLSTPSVGLYVDQVAYFDKTAFSFDLFDVERIEILRGPQGTLYGRNTMGGIINVVTRKPTNTFSTRLMADYGSFNEQRYRVAVSVPIIADKLFVKASGTYNQRDGYNFNKEADKYIDTKNDVMGRFQLRYFPISALDVQIQFMAEKTDDGGYAYGHLDSLSKKPYVVDYNSDSFYSRNMYNGSLRMSYDAGSFSINSITGWQYYDDVQQVDQDFTPRDLYTVNNSSDQSLYTQELNFKSGNSEKIDWIGGLYGFSQLSFNDVRLFYGTAAPSTLRNYVKFSDRYSRGVAAFGQFTVKNIFPTIDLTLGLRYDMEQSGIDYLHKEKSGDAFNPVDTFINDLTAVEWLPKVIVKHSITDDINTYVSFAKGYKSGGFNVTFDKPYEQNYEPEYSLNYEWGIKGAFWDRKIQTGMALFYIESENLQISQLRASGKGSMIKNAGSSRSQGAEFEFTAYWTNNFNTQVSVGYTDARFVDYKDTIKKVDYSGKVVPFVPFYTYNVSAEYRIPVKFYIMQYVSLSADYQGIGKHFWDDANLSSQKAYNLVNGRIALISKYGSLSFWTKNLLDEAYNVYAFELSKTNYYGQLGAPRRFGVSLNINF